MSVGIAPRVVSAQSLRVARSHTPTVAPLRVEKFGPNLGPLTPKHHRKPGNQRPESQTNQQLGQPCEICKTSTPGSNPGGASNFH
jgi:hypothetical protein